MPSSERYIPSYPVFSDGANVDVDDAGKVVTSHAVPKVHSYMFAVVDEQVYTAVPSDLNQMSVVDAGSKFVVSCASDPAVVKSHGVDKVASHKYLVVDCAQ